MTPPEEASLLMIVRRGATDRFRLLQESFVREPVQILWDRREGERRQSRHPGQVVERRSENRRQADPESREHPWDGRSRERRQRDAPRMPERRRHERRAPTPASWTALDFVVARSDAAPS